MKLFGVVLGLVLVVSLAGAVGAAAGAQQVRLLQGRRGTCFCDKKAKCGCPGDCEPKGCEAQRDKELQKEIDAETKKAAASGHKKRAATRRARRKRKRARRPRPRRGHKMTAAQSKQLAKLLDLYLSDHPDARGKSIEDVRSDVSGH